MTVLGIIPARGGSKGIPRKNIRILGEKPLLQYTAEAALAARCLSRVILSTDDAEIAEVGRRCGLDVPFLRPASLARDDTPTLPVVQHALRWHMAHGDAFDAVCILQPTHPFRTAEDIDGCIEHMVVHGAETVVTVLRVPPEYNPHWVLFSDEQGHLSWACGGQAPIPRRQLLPPAFCREGSVYVVRTHVVLEQNSLYGSPIAGYEVERRNRVNLDTHEDWMRAESLVSAVQAS